MRTRRSPRNQERLWRELGGVKKPARTRARLPSRAEARAQMFGGIVDPNATWQCLIESLKDLHKCPNNGDTRAHVVDCLEVLATWIRRGGFPPKVEE